MAKKQWIFVTKVFVQYEGDTDVSELGVFEAVGISPYKAANWGMKTDEYLYLPNAAAMGDLINNIGDKNAFSLKKVTDATSPILIEAFTKNWAIAGINLSITQVTPTIERYRGTGRTRLEFLWNNALEVVMTRDVGITDYGTFHPHGYGKPGATYDSFAFDVGEVHFLFKGKDF